MVDQEAAVREHARPERMQDFIFQRELAEVYLLLDYLSGRANQSLAKALADETGGKVSIEQICNISWPPVGQPTEQAEQAAILLLAKDKLNMAAQPASGASIAFTLLVAGDDESKEASRRENRGLRGWFRKVFASSPPAAPVSPPAASAPAPAAGGGAPPAPPPPGAGGEGIWSGGAPSRTSLARLAYPAMIGRARRFSWGTKAVILLLFGWLILTCLLSWHVAAGRAIVARLDSMEKDRTTIDGKIEKAEVGPAQTQAAPAPAPSPAPAQQAAATPVLRYCERYLVLPFTDSADGTRKLSQYESATQRQLCDQLNENRLLYESSCGQARDWLAPWRFFRIESAPSYQNACVAEVSSTNPASISEHQRASVLVEILATAVLPIFYGILGAGAAAVRDLWSKMRDFLLLPRDMTLSLGRLALGAVIGACIGLFVSPTGAAGQTGSGLTTAVTLTPSALSFIAGFGVEGIFVALETFIKRVFNIPDPK